MSNNLPFNYTDGVPVKISEKFKPPPEIQLTTKLTQQLLKTKVPVAFQEDYNFDLEHKILSKTTEWINWRLKEKTERQHRIQLREIARQKQLEEEQKAKLNQVSYPSADELTSEDELEESQDCVEAIQKPCNEIDNSNKSNNMISEKIKNQQNIPSSCEKVFSPNFNTILMPTQAVNQSVSDKKSHRRYASNSSNKIDFSFFESDASPFDNLEIKSMNEMEELAKVLQSTAVHENQDYDENILERNNSSESEPSDQSGQNNLNNNNINENESFITKVSSDSEAIATVTTTNMTMKNEINPYHQHAHGNLNPQQLYNNYYYGMQPSTTNNQSTSFYNNTQQQRYGTLTPTHSQYSTSPYYMNQRHQLPNNNHHYYTQNYAVSHMNYAHVSNVSSSNNNHVACERNDKTEGSNKSRSVPDIVKELSDELNNSERRRRIRNISQSNQKSDEMEAIPADTSEEDQFQKLPIKSQNLAKQICQMGFKQDIVIRTLIRLGDNDKNIVEHLISLNEILQMGFDEDRISEALIKFNNNKDQALDYLIS